jgi:hypothetical protein
MQNAPRDFVKGFSSIKQTLVIDNNEAYKLKCECHHGNLAKLAEI